MNTGQSPAHHISSPFDGSAVDRQKRMGLLTEDGAVNETAIEIVGRVQAGLFFDQISDSCRNLADAKAICDRLVEKAQEVDLKHTLLLVSLQYDAMHRTLPEVIWWISGSKMLLTPFMSEFIKHLKAVAGEIEV